MAAQTLVNGENNGNLENSPPKSSHSDDVGASIDVFSDTWGFKLDDLYKIAVLFFKEKVGSRALQVGYKDKLRMVALTKQVSHGPYNTNAMPAVGWFDVVGNDRRLAWQSLGDMNKEAAMSEFVSFLRKNCPQFAPYVQAQFAEKEEQERKRKEQEDDERRSREELQRLQLDAAHMQEEEKKRQLDQEMKIRAALNQQTAVQFRQYAEEQYPGNTVQQDTLIRQLQDQHYIQYMHQLYNQQILMQQQQMAAAVGLPAVQQQAPAAAASQPSQSLHQQQQVQQQQALQQQQVQQQQQQQQNHTDNNSVSVNISPQKQQAVKDTVHHVTTLNEKPLSTNNVASNSFTPSKTVQISPSTSSPSSPKHLANGLQKTPVTDSYDGSTNVNTDEDPDASDLQIAAASMWTRKDVKEFKDSVKNDTESVIKVGSGEIVTVRVPTHEDGSCLFWEFATDSYDIGFGVYFEWTVEPTNQMSVQVSESSEEEEDDPGQTSNNEQDAAAKAEPEVPTEEIVPPFRRDCHQEVYCGSHVYPGRGVYLLKFDNSYSLWRGKTLYYRVYYTR